MFPPPQVRDSLVWFSGGLTGGQRRRLLRDVNGACDTLNWMHGKDGRPRGSSSTLVATEDKNQCLCADVQQRVLLAAMPWVDAGIAVD